MNTKVTHTPGPWRWAINPSKGCKIEIKSGRHRIIATLPYHEDSDGEPDSRLNATLIAAAPELLEAAKIALTAMNYDGAPESNDRIVAKMGLRRAIAKAEGEKS